jgi:two-component sensor histidine kinase
LSDRQVNAIQKDSRGLLWVGTKYGLNSFDGYSFKIYTKEQNGLPFNHISTILEDADGILWLIGPSGKTEVALFDPVNKKVISFEGKFGRSGKMKLKDVITDNAKTIYLTPEDEDFVYVYTPSRGLYKKDISAIAPLSYLYRSPSNKLYAISKDSTMLELDTAFHVLNSQKFDIKIKTTVHGPRSNGFIIRESVSHGVPRIFYLRYPFSITEFRDKDLPPRDSTAVDFIFETEIDGITWRQGKLYNKDKELIIDFVKMGYKDVSAGLRGFFYEAGKELWLGNNFGLYMITVNKNKFKNYFTNPAFNEDHLSSFRSLLVLDNKLYGNNEAKGICINDLKTNKDLFISTGKDFGGYTFLQSDNSGNILQGCYYGLNKINILTGKSTPYYANTKLARCWSLCKISNEICIAGTEGGLLYFNAATNTFLPFEKYNQFTELKNAIVISIAKDRTENCYWLCSNSGLYKLDLQKGITGCYSSAMKGEFNLPTENVHAFYQDAEGITWIACAEGLIRIDNKTKQKKIFTRSDGLSDNTIYAVFEDSGNNLWLSSNYGLMCFDKKTFKVKTYLVEDGISNNEFNRISAHKDNTGKFYFGTLNGVTSFDPRDFLASGNEPRSPFVINSFFQFDRDSGKMIDKTAQLLRENKITVEPDDKLFTLDYVLLNYNYAGENLYARRIEGVDDEWIYSKEHSLSISSLPYGEHILHLKAKAVNTLWSEPLDILIRVNKPFYLESWFFISLFVLTSLLIYAVFLIRTQQYRKAQFLLKKEVRRQTATITEQSLELKTSLHQKETLLKEIHHRVKNNLQVISGLLSLQGSDSKSEELKAIMKEGRNRVKSMALIHQMLYQNENLNQVNFQEYLLQLTKEISAGFSKSSSAVEIKINANEIALDVDTAIPLGLIINELVTNALKYAYSEPGGVIEISLEKLEENTFRLVVNDFGKGLPVLFDFEKASSLGLKLVKMLCNQLRAKINFDRSGGTKVEIIFTDTWKK